MGVARQRRRLSDGCAASRVERVLRISSLALSVSSLYLAKNQTYRGQCSLIFDLRHAARPDQLTPDQWAAFCADLYVAQHAVVSVTQPDHVNIESLGNVVPHLHWHIIPRYVGDPRWGMPICTTPLSATADARLEADEDLAPSSSSRRRSGKVPRTRCGSARIDRMKSDSSVPARHLVGLVDAVAWCSPCMFYARIMDEHIVDAAYLRPLDGRHESFCKARSRPSASGSRRRWTCPATEELLAEDHVLDELFATRGWKRCAPRPRSSARCSVGHSMGTPRPQHTRRCTATAAGLVLVDGLVQVAGRSRDSMPPPMIGTEDSRARENMVRGMFGTGELLLSQTNRKRAPARRSDCGWRDDAHG